RSRSIQNIVLSNGSGNAQMPSCSAASTRAAPQRIVLNSPPLDAASTSGLRLTDTPINSSAPVHGDANLSHTQSVFARFSAIDERKRTSGRAAISTSTPNSRSLREHHKKMEGCLEDQNLATAQLETLRENVNLLLPKFEKHLTYPEYGTDIEELRIAPLKQTRVSSLHIPTSVSSDGWPTNFQTNPLSFMPGISKFIVTFLFLL
ncbi:hypothetical protein L9F63_028302, partial [Diploptera punctata]